MSVTPPKVINDTMSAQTFRLASVHWPGFSWMTEIPQTFLAC